MLALLAPVLTAGMAFAQELPDAPKSARQCSAAEVDASADGSAD
jgi:hypothetical protein